MIVTFLMMVWNFVIKFRMHFEWSRDFVSSKTINGSKNFISIRSRLELLERIRFVMFREGWKKTELSSGNKLLSTSSSSFAFLKFKGTFCCDFRCGKSNFTGDLSRFSDCGFVFRMSVVGFVDEVSMLFKTFLVRDFFFDERSRYIESFDDLWSFMMKSLRFRFFCVNEFNEREDGLKIDRNG